MIKKYEKFIESKTTNYTLVSFSINELLCDVNFTDLYNTGLSEVIDDFKEYEKILNLNDEYGVHDDEETEFKHIIAEDNINTILYDYIVTLNRFNIYAYNFDLDDFTLKIISDKNDNEKLISFYGIEDKHIYHFKNKDPKKMFPHYYYVSDRNI